MLLILAGEAQAYCLPWDHAATTFNASRDLNRIHPSLSDMTPNDEGVDSAPLLAAAIKYVIANRDCSKLVVDEGAYYFNKVSENKSKSAYVLIENASSLNIDLRGANLVFKESFYSAFYIDNCNSCTLSNFSIDYQHLPFTQLNVTKVTWEEIIAVPQPDWPNVDQLYRHQSQVTGQFQSLLFQGFDTRGGVPQYDYTAWTLLMPLPPGKPSHPHRIPLDATSKPQRVIQEGDVFIVAARGGGPAIYEENSAGTTFQNITIYTSGGPGIESWASKAMSFIGIQIVPNAGRLVSTVAGGIQLNNMSGPGNVVRNCLIIGAQDDSIAGNMSVRLVSATVVGGGIDIPVAPPNNPVFFVNGTTGETIGGPPTAQNYNLTLKNGTTYSVDPPLTPKQANAFGTSLVYSWDQFAADKSVIVQDNKIWYSYLARGIAFVGVSGVEITHNVVVGTQQAGILVEADMVPSGKDSGFTNGPVADRLQSSAGDEPRHVGRRAKDAGRDRDHGLRHRWQRLEPTGQSRAGVERQHDLKHPTRRHLDRQYAWCRRERQSQLYWPNWPGGSRPWQLASSQQRPFALRPYSIHQSSPRLVRGRRLGHRANVHDVSSR
jgi:hypothetical protein